MPSISDLPTIDALTAADLLAVSDVSDAGQNPKKVAVVEVLKLVYPVGSLYFSTDSTNPATSLGFGTWAAFGVGRMPVGFDAGQTEFDTDEKTGGAKTVALTAAQSGLPAHGHAVTDPGHTHVENSNNTTTGSLRGWGAPDTSTNQSTATGYSTASAVTGVTVGDAAAQAAAEAHPNLPPYIVVRMWKRTA